MGSVEAINAQRMAMRDTGRDVKDKYEETSRDGLAVNVIKC